MTVAIGWIRKVNNCEEMLFASDSRLCGGYRWDECPKILPLQRSDCAICFAGDTAYSYPIMMQIYFAVGEVMRIRTRAMDITELNGYVLKHANHLAKSIYDEADHTNIFENEFLFGGYSWVDKKFKMWRYIYNKTDDQFQKDGKERNFERRFGHIFVIGDQKNNYVLRLREYMKNKYGDNFENYHGEKFDMEPFEVLRDMLKESTPHDTIGGAPQLVKVYQHMNARAVGVYWPKKEDDSFKNRKLMGRSMFDFEDTDYWFIDPETLRTNPCVKNTNNDEYSN